MKRMAVLSIRKEKGIDEIPELLSRLGIKLESVRLALVKPNLCGYYPPSPPLIGAVLDVLERSSEKIVLGDTDSAIHRTEEMFRRRGYEKFASDKVELRNLLNDRVHWCSVPSPHAVEKFPLPESAIACDIMVNIPGLGTHGNTLLTCASKNLFGLISSRRKFSEYHPLGIDEVIADICKIVKPTVNIVDARERLLIGKDVFQVDIVAARMLGLDPSRVKHLNLIAQDRGMKIDEVEIELLEL
jgi:uncharacterized protein (DUF362 family)